MKSKLVLMAVALLTAQLSFAATNNDDATDDSSDAAPVTKSTHVKKTSSSSESVFSRIIPEVSLSISTFAGSGATNASSKTGFGVGALTDIGHSDFVFE